MNLKFNIERTFLGLVTLQVEEFQAQIDRVLQSERRLRELAQVAHIEGKRSRFSDVYMQILSNYNVIYGKQPRKMQWKTMKSYC